MVGRLRKITDESTLEQRILEQLELRPLRKHKQNQRTQKLLELRLKTPRERSLELRTQEQLTQEKWELLEVLVQRLLRV